MLLEEKHRPDKIKYIAGNHKLMSGFQAEVDAVNKDNTRLKQLFDALPKIKDDAKQKKILNEIGRIKTHKIRHRIFAGDAGCGKTTTAEAMGKEIYGKDYGDMFIEINGSVDRSLVYVRSVIKNLTSTGTRNYAFMIIFIDEIDGMDKKAQESLRRIIELSTSAVFFMACNDIDKVTSALQSRATVCRFLPVPVAEAVEKLKQICDAESIQADDAVLEELYLSRFGDLRSAIGRLGQLAVQSNIITMEMIEDQPVDNDIFDTFYAFANAGQIRKAYRHFLKSRINAGFSREDFAMMFAKRMLNLDIDAVMQAKIFTFIKKNKIGNESDIGILGLAGEIFLARKEINDEKNNENVLKKMKAWMKNIEERFDKFEAKLDAALAAIKKDE